MVLFKIFLFSLQILLETTVFSNYTTSTFNNKNLFYSVLLLGAFLNCFSLYKFSKMFVLIIQLCDLVLGLYLLKTFYHVNMNINNEIYILILFSFIIITFLYSNSEEAYKEFEESKSAQSFIFFILNVIITYLYFFHFKNLHLKDAETLENLEKIDWIKFAMEFGVDYLILFNMVTVINLLKMRNSKTKKSTYFWAVVKRGFFLLVLTLVFYTNYNKILKEVVYNYFNKYVPQPHNVVLYNCLPLDPDMRFRMITSALIYLIF